MAVLSIDRNKCDGCGLCVSACPFEAIALKKGLVQIEQSCRLCKMCTKRCPNGALYIKDEDSKKVDKHQWNGIMVFVEHMEGEIHPVTIELIGKARELSSVINQPVYCIFMGYNILEKAHELLHYGMDKVFVYDHKELEHFRVDIWANAFEECISSIKPSVVLVGATSIGRSLAPKMAARFHTGLTADCTRLEIKENTDLVQIRPAFGGNIMAQIVTPNSRPQFATVRYKVMDKALWVENPTGIVESRRLEENKLKSDINVIKVTHKEKQLNISDAEIIVAAGRGLKEQKDLGMIEELANLLGGQVAVTRPMVEAGWAPYTRQIGLSGRTVKPKLIITCGISGAVQFTACMNTADKIIAINKDKNAPIFKAAHFGIVGDLYEVIPELIARIKEEKAHGL